MIGSADLFRAWNDVGANGLSDIERIARAEYPDGDRLLLRQATAARVAREPTILRRFAAALHLVRAREQVPAATRASGIQPGIAAVHFAGQSEVRPEADLLSDSQTVALVSYPEGCRDLQVECNEP